jgi:hypothetical protein
MIKYSSISKMQQWIVVVSVWFFAAFSIISCSDMTDDYKKYLEGGEIIYPAKADSLEAHPGKNRIELQWLLLSDPSVSSAIVYWNAGRDSQNVILNRTPGVTDTIRVMIENLEEGTYTFEIYTFNEDGNRSVGSEITGNALGERFESSLLNEFYSLNYNSNKGGFITWSSDQDDVIGFELNYKTNEGNPGKVFVSKGDSVFSLPDFDHVSPVTYRTAFFPLLAVDTFYADFSPIELGSDVNVAVNKPVSVSSVFSTYIGENAVNGNTKSDNSNRFVSQNIPNNGPQWIAIDLEKELLISSVKLYCQDVFSEFYFQKEVEGEWQDIIVETENQDSFYTKTFEATPARQLRLYVTAITGGSGNIRLYEMEIFTKFINLF